VNESSSSLRKSDLPGAASPIAPKAPKPMGEFLVPLIVGCALFMETLDSNIITTALPVMARSLHESPITLNLAITSYLLSLAVFIPVSGWVADRYGARKVFRTAIILFTCGSILCGLSHSLLQLIVSRVLQGFGGAMMVPVGRLVVLRTVEKSDLVQAMSYLTVPAMLGPVLGPLVGGFIVTYYSWRWIFFLNVPICLLGIVLVTLLVPDISQQDASPFDYAGFLLTGLGLAAVVAGLETVGRGMFPNSIVIAVMFAGATCLTGYWFHCKRFARPIIDLKLLKIQTFSTSTIGGGLFRAGFGALPFLLAMQLQLAFGISPFFAGLLTFFSAAGAFLMKFTVHRMVRSFGFRNLLIYNSILTAATVLLCALFRPTTPHVVIALVLLLGGFFRGLQFTTLGALAYADVPPRILSSASSLAGMAQQLFMSLGVTVGALVLHVCLAVHGRQQVTPHDFVIAFTVIAAVSQLSLIYFVRMDRDAGQEVSGYRSSASRRKQYEEVEAAVGRMAVSTRRS
jgi:EmrB/QacA subfamily drug resistance transporter